LLIGAAALVLVIAAVLVGVFQAKRPAAETAAPIAQTSPPAAPEAKATPAPPPPQPVAVTAPEPLPKPAPTPPPLPTELKILAEPAQATVWRGEQQLGTPPFTLPKTATGEYLVRHAGYLTARIDPASLPATQGEVKVSLRPISAEALVGTWDFLHGPVRTGSELDRRYAGATRRSVTNDERLIEFAVRDGALAITRFNIATVEQSKAKEGNNVRTTVCVKWPGNFSCVADIAPLNKISVRSEMDCPFEVEAVQFVPATASVVFKSGYSGTITTTITSPQKLKPRVQKQSFYTKQVFALDEFGEKLVDIEEERMANITPELVRTRIAQHFKPDENEDVKPTYAVRIASSPAPPITAAPPTPTTPAPSTPAVSSSGKASTKSTASRKPTPKPSSRSSSESAPRSSESSSGGGGSMRQQIELQYRRGYITREQYQRALLNQ
jgi:type IV secretory pathway VirB10-like protein